MNMNPGSWVYMKKIKTSSDQGAAEFTFQGHAFGILLGHVKKGEKEPNETQFWNMAGAAGFCSFDIIQDVLGKEAMDKVITEFEKRYT